MLAVLKHKIALSSLLVLLVVPLYTALGFTRTTSVGLNVGLFLPASDWKDHRYAPAIDQFSTSFTFDVDLESKLMSWGGLGFKIGYVNLNMSKWEDYSRSQGDAINASAYLIYAGPVLKPYLWSDKYNIVKLELGIPYVTSDGDESFDSFIYQYDFLAERIGFLVGLEYDRHLSNKAALVLKISTLIVPSGVIYADGLDYTVIGLPFTLGVRFHF